MALRAEVCERCKRGKLLVRSSPCNGEYRTQYLRCTACGCTPKRVVPVVAREKLFTDSQR